MSVPLIGCRLFIVGFALAGGILSLRMGTVIDALDVLARWPYI
jgi:hypothetical protein